MGLYGMYIALLLESLDHSRSAFAFFVFEHVRLVVLNYEYWPKVRMRIFD